MRMVLEEGYVQDDILVLVFVEQTFKDVILSARACYEG